jgi:hypothetical protein
LRPEVMVVEAQLALDAAAPLFGPPAPTTSEGPPAVGNPPPLRVAPRVGTGSAAQPDNAERQASVRAARCELRRCVAMLDIIKAKN